MFALKKQIKKLVPSWALSAYHFCLAVLGAYKNGHPSKHLTVIGVTGTKGKSSTIEFLNGIFEAAGYTTASTSTIRFKIGAESTLNRRKMSLPGRFFIQNFLRKAADNGCTIAFLEMTSEGTLQHRHRFIAFDGLIFTNLSPEHIEAHGSYQNYREAKLNIARAVVSSPKRPRYMVANADDPEGAPYLRMQVEHPLPYSIETVRPFSADEHGSSFTLENTKVVVHLPGLHNLYNALAAATLARAMGITPSVIATGIASVRTIPGRTEEIKVSPLQTFAAVVDYAHTPESLRALYSAYGSRKKVCVLGATGGGRDIWKRPVMGAVADELCAHTILTNEDPYDEDPEAIMRALKSGFKVHTPEMIVDRRMAIRRALELVEDGGAVLVSGKGSESTMMLANGTKTEWSDTQVLREELLAYFAAREHAQTSDTM